VKLPCNDDVKSQRAILFVPGAMLPKSTLRAGVTGWFSSWVADDHEVDEQALDVIDNLRLAAGDGERLGDAVANVDDLHGQRVREARLNYRREWIVGEHVPVMEIPHHQFGLRERPGWARPRSEW